MSSNVTIIESVADYQRTVPYQSAGRHNPGFIDLRKQPERIDELPELIDRPALRDLIRSINGSGSLYTISCNAAMEHSDLRQFSRRFGSYVQIAFSDPWLNFNQACFRGFKAALVTFIDPLPNDRRCEIELELVPTFFSEQDNLGWSVNIWSHGYGEDKSLARAAWAMSGEMVSRFISAWPTLPEMKVTLDPLTQPEPKSPSEWADFIVMQIEWFAHLFRTAAIPEIEIMALVEGLLTKADLTSRMDSEDRARVTQAARRAQYTWANEVPTAYQLARANVQRIDGSMNDISKALAPFVGEKVQVITQVHIQKYGENKVFVGNRPISGRPYTKDDPLEGYIDLLESIPKDVVAADPDPENKLRLVIESKDNESGLPEIGRRKQSRKEQRHKKINRQRAAEAIASEPPPKNHDINAIAEIDLAIASAAVGLPREQALVIEARKEAGRTAKLDELGIPLQILDGVRESLNKDGKFGAPLREKLDVYHVKKQSKALPARRPKYSKTRRLPLPGPSD